MPWAAPIRVVRKITENAGCIVFSSELYSSTTKDTKNTKKRRLADISSCLETAMPRKISAHLNVFVFFVLFVVSIS